MVLISTHCVLSLKWAKLRSSNENGGQTAALEGASHHVAGHVEEVTTG